VKAGPVPQRQQGLLLVAAVLAWLLPVHGNCEVQGESAAIKLNLEQAILYGLEHNRSLQSARLGVSSSKMSVQTAESEFDLKVIPLGNIGYNSADENSWQAGATLSKSFTSGVDVSVAPRVSEYGDEKTTNVGFSMNLPLLRGAGSEFALSGVYSSRYAYENARLSYYTQQVNTVLQTVSSIYISIRSSLQTELLEKQLEMLSSHLALAKIKERSGIISALDLYRAEIRLNDVQNEITSARELHADNLDSVKDVLGIPQRGEVVLTAPLEFTPLRIDQQEALAIAEENRIEIERARRAVDENRRLLAIARNNLLPRLDMQLGYNLSGDGVFEDISEENWTVSLQSNTDLFRAGEQNAFAQQQIQLKQSQLDLESSKQQVYQQVRKELNSLEKQERRIELRKDQVRQTVGKLRLAQSKFENGMTDNFVLIEAQTELQEAESNLLFERINYINGMYRLRSALGTLLARSAEDKAGRAGTAIQ
jgi:outer membrane protein